MKTLAALILLLFTSIVGAQTLPAPIQDAGLYQGVITVQRNTPELRTKDTTTLLINAELYYSLPTGIGGSPSLTVLWTARNYDLSAKLANAWALVQFSPTAFPVTIPDMNLSGTSLKIFGGTLISGSYKNTRTTLAWKCTKETTLFSRRKSIITTSFSISRIGPLPAASP